MSLERGTVRPWEENMELMGGVWRVGRQFGFSDVGLIPEFEAKESEVTNRLRLEYALEWESEGAKQHRDGKTWVRNDVVPRFLKEFEDLNLTLHFNHPSIVEVRISPMCIDPLTSRYLPEYLPLHQEYKT